ncbi:hypothetical protein [Acidimangrovimonas pyrenivorans]|uniref:Lipoprotein n=1 Tax=Acidimangrovimonas pyrenivorans TaxID=2030798 RepID=A0ABV7AKU2_9RHOB
MRPVLPLMLVLAVGLAACGTPQERCIDRATRDLRVVSGLIDQLQVDIDRGYRMVPHQVTFTRWVPCHYPPPPLPPKPGVKPPPPPPPRMCLEDFTHTVRRPRAIDIAAEKRKLKQLRVKRVELQRRAEAEIAACKARYPE